MNAIKVLSISLLIGSTFWACNTEDTEPCYVCTATDPNGIGDPVSDAICADIITEQMRDDFRAEFESQHNPASYDISCVLNSD